MKRLLLILSLGIVGTAQAQNVPNRGFEHWESELIFELPEYWATSNERDGRFNVSKNIDGHTGFLCLRMQNGRDSSFGYFMMGHVGENGPDGGFPYSSIFDSVTGWYKCNMMAGDTALVITGKFGPNDTTMVMSPIYGTANNWTRFAFEVPSHPQTHVFFGIVSTNPFVDGNYFPDSWIEIDDVAFTYSGSSTPDTLENASFERWESIESEEPVNWNSLNFMGNATGQPASVEASTDAYRGTYAVRIRTVDVPGSRKIGWLYNGLAPGPAGFLGGFAYNAIPTSLSGYYKYTPNGPDTAIVAVVGSFYDEEADSTVQRFFAHAFLTARSDYTHFEIPIYYDTTQTLNQINIVAGSSIKLFDHPEQAQAGTSLFLDELWLDSRCAFADTTKLFAFSDTTIRYNRTETPIFAMDSVYHTYLWSTGDTTYWIEVTQDPMQVYVTVTDSNGCAFTDSLNLGLDFRAAVKQIAKDLRFFPNPAKELVFVPANGHAVLMVFNSSGQMMLQTALQPGLNGVNLVDLSPGEYILIVEEKGNMKYGLLLKQ